MVLSNLPWGEMFAAALGGGSVTKVADLVFGRKSREVKALGETIGILSAQQKQFGDDLSGMRTDLNACHESHRRCEEGRETDRQAYQAEIAELKANIDKLLGEPPLPPYHPKNLKRVAK